MDLDIQGKTALVTGSTDGIGFAIAKELVHEGVTVYINGRTSEKVKGAIAKLEGNLKEAPFDLGTKEGCNACIQAIPEVDFLINNMGIFELKPFEHITDEEWFKMFETNVMSGIRLSRHYFPKMLAKKSGRILFISSESGVNIPKDMIHYGMSKTSQLAVARGLAELTVSTAITVNSLLVGPTYSTGVERFLEQMAEKSGSSVFEVEKEFFNKDRPGSLLHRFINPDEISGLVAYLMSDRAIAINGAALRIEGGLLRSIL